MPRLVLDDPGPDLPFAPQSVQIQKTPSLAQSDPLVKRARQLKLYVDFKTLADLSARKLSDFETNQIRQQTQQIRTRQGEIASLRYWIHSVYESRDELLPVNDPSVLVHWTMKESPHRLSFDHIEQMWQKLARRTPPKTRSSLIPLPYPFVIAGARFNEVYYWDSYFFLGSLLRTGRAKLARAQIDNLLYLRRHYGLVPNGNRQYYLKRSQPPLLSQMLRQYLEYEIKKENGLSPWMKTWLQFEAYPEIKADYENFWMKEGLRYTAATGLNHFNALLENSPAERALLQIPREEAHSSDNDARLTKSVGETKAECESGEDFTEAFQGEATQIDPIGLNSIMYGMEKDLAWMAQLLEDSSAQKRFEGAALRRVQNIHRWLWDPSSKTFRNRNRRTHLQVPVLTAAMFMPLHYGIATPAEAEGVMGHLPELEGAGGITSTDVASNKQWGKPYGWAPHQYYAISGAIRYAYRTEALRLAQKYLAAIDRIFQRSGKIPEKFNALTGDLAVETGQMYETQDGFGWSNGVFEWCLTVVLGEHLIPL